MQIIFGLGMLLAEENTSLWLFQTSFRLGQDAFILGGKTMTIQNLTGYRIKKLMTLAIILFWISSISIIPVFGHGGKHAAGEFTHLQALQKATEMYDRLIANGKLDQSWETTLMRVNVSNRQKENEMEIVVSFQRAEGEPQSVYIFFTAKGEYAGSNFTGE